MRGSAPHPLKPFLKEGLKDPKNFRMVSDSKFFILFFKAL